MDFGNEAIAKSIGEMFHGYFGFQLSLSVVLFERGSHLRIIGHRAFHESGLVSIDILADVNGSRTFASRNATNFRS
jgi:hypothetical protein